MNSDVRGASCLEEMLRSPNPYLQQDETGSVIIFTP